MVAFANTETLSNEKANNTNLCFDFGFGKDSKGVHFGVQEAF